jgi:ABC-type nickel/cobalt efflux system permease component RcnA
METSWKMAASATLHCLTGCAIGEVLGMVIGTALGLSNAATIVIAVGLAFFFGYALTMLPFLRSGMNLRKALSLALAADTISIAVMEVTDNGFMILIPGAMGAGLQNLLFWISLAASLAVAFFIAWPVNRYLISKGKGHAVVHEMHGSHDSHDSHHGHHS